MHSEQQSIMLAEHASDRHSSGPLTSLVCDSTALPQNVYNITLSVLALDEHRQKILRWLSAPDPSSNYNIACKKRQPTTGAWFVEGEEFADWKKDLGSFIWLHGIRTFC